MDIITPMTRLAALLEADPAFAGRVITETERDIATSVAKALQETGMGLCITLGPGQREGDALDPTILRQEYTVALTRNPVLTTTPLTIPEMVHKAIALLDQALVDTDLSAIAPDNTFRLVDHAPVAAEADMEIHHLTFQATLNL